VKPALSDALLAAMFGDAVGSIALPLTSRDGVRHVVQVLPLRASGRRAAAVFVAPATFEAPSCPDVIRRAYRLTPTELRVLFAIVDVGGVPEAAAALGIANSTVKTHLGRLFSKTGTSRQADLVKLVAAFSQRPVARPLPDTAGRDPDAPGVAGPGPPPLPVGYSGGPKLRRSASARAVSLNSRSGSINPRAAIFRSSGNVLFGSR